MVVEVRQGSAIHFIVKVNNRGAKMFNSGLSFLSLFLLMVLTYSANANEVNNHYQYNLNFQPSPNCVERRLDQNVKAVAPSRHILVNSNRQFKNDGHPFLLTTFHISDIVFWNSYEGHVGVEFPNIENNAYMAMSFPIEARGLQFFTTRELRRTPCSAARFYVQNAPTLNRIDSNIVQVGDRVRGTMTAMGGNIDTEYSKNAVEGKSIEYYWEIKREAVVRQAPNGNKWCDVSNADYAGWEFLQSGSSNNFSFNYYACPFSVRVTVRDGVYSSAPEVEQVTSFLGGNNGGSGNGSGGSTGTCDLFHCETEQ